MMELPITLKIKKLRSKIKNTECVKCHKRVVYVKETSMAICVNCGEKFKSDLLEMVDDLVKLRQKFYFKKYLKTEKGIKAVKKYELSDKGKDRLIRYKNKIRHRRK